MRTIPAALAPFLNGSSSPIWVLKIQKTEGVLDPNSNADFWPGTTDVRYFTSGQVAWSDRAALLANYSLHEDRVNIKSIKNVVSKLSNAARQTGGLVSKDSFTFYLDNTDGGIIGKNPALAFVGVNFEGRAATLYITDASLTDKADVLEIFVGEVNDLRIDGDRIRFEIESFIEAYDAELPPRIYEESTGPEAVSNDLIGSRIPLVFGEHDMVEGFIFENITDTGSADQGPKVKFADVEDLDIFSLPSMRFGDSGLVDATGGFARIMTGTMVNMSQYTAYSSDLSEGVINFHDPNIEELHIAPEITPVGFYQYSSGEIPIDGERAYDKDDTTFSNLTALNNSSSTAELGLKLPNITLFANVHDNTGDSFTGVSLLLKADLQINSSGRLAININRKGAAYPPTAGLSIPTVFGSGSNGPVDNRASGTMAAWQFSKGSVCSWNSGYSTLTALSSRFVLIMPVWWASYIDVYETLLRVGCSLDLPSKGYFADMKGYKDVISGLYTGTASSLIENPAHLISVFYSKFSSAGGSNVEVLENRNVAATTRSGWKFANQLTELEDLNSVVNNFSKEAFFWTWLNDGKIQVTPWEIGNDAVFPILSRDVSNGRLDDFQRTRKDDIVTDFEIKYKWNPVRDDFDETIICNATESSSGLGSTYENLCKWAAYDNGARSKKKTYKLYWIRDAATALLVAKKLIQFHTSRRWGFRATGDISWAHLQLGDKVSPDEVTSIWPDSYPADMLSGIYRISEVRARPDTDRISIRTVEVFS